MMIARAIHTMMAAVVFIAALAHGTSIWMDVFFHERVRIAILPIERISMLMI